MPATHADELGMKERKPAINRRSESLNKLTRWGEKGAPQKHTHAWDQYLI